MIKYLFYLLKVNILFFNGIIFAQSQNDLELLNLLPENQAQSIAERLGIATGKPLREEIVMESVDAPRFSSMTPKEEITIEQETNTFGYITQVVS